MKIGFTGTQIGMTKSQESYVDRLLTERKGVIEEVHHGDCIGADTDFHNLALKTGIDIVIHPPLNPRKRSFCTGYLAIREEKEYIARNHDIVDATEILVATPKGPEELRSGTWATIRYALRRGKMVVIIYPDGTVEVRNKKNPT